MLLGGLLTWCPHFPLVDSSPVCINEVLRYVVWRLGSVVCLGVAVASHHIAETGPRADVAYKFLDNVHAVSTVINTVMAFLGVHSRLWLLFHMAFCFVVVVP